MIRSKRYHYTYAEMVAILTDQGLDAENAAHIADALVCYPYYAMDSLYRALAIIRQGHK